MPIAFSKASKAQHRRRGVFQWKDPGDVVPARTSDRLVITVATGDEYHRLLKVTRPSIEAYARNCGADFVALTNLTQAWWGFEKFRVLPFAQEYAQTLFVDADCIIRANCPNLFETVGGLALHDDFQFVPDPTWLPVVWADLARSQRIREPFIGRCLNTGVVLCDQARAAIWEPPRLTVPGTHCDEQLWIDASIDRNGFEFRRLDRVFNHQWWMPDFDDPERFKAAQIIHLANHPDRVNGAAKIVDALRAET